MINIGHKIKIKNGSDANQMMVYKLVSNFIRTGKMEVTVKRARVIKSKVDRLISQAKEDKVLHVSHKLNDKVLVDRVFKTIVPALKDQKFGFVKMRRLGPRLGDGAELARIEWVTPIKEPVAPVKATSTKELEVVKPASAKALAGKEK